MDNKRQSASDSPKDEWKMPEPVFRVSGGTTITKSDAIRVELKKPAANSENRAANDEPETRKSKIFFAFGALLLLTFLLLAAYFLFFYKTGT